MHWFHLAFFCCLIATLICDLGIITGVLYVGALGTSEQSIETDPSKNGTMPIYILMLTFQVFLIASVIYGMVLCIQVSQNAYQLDKKLRQHFSFWVLSWVIVFLGILGIGTYSIIRGRDVNGQVRSMHEMFQNNIHDAKYIASLQKYQRQNHCCGIKGADDWLMAQLLNSPSAEMNPNTGSCHLDKKALPPGCGEMLLKDVSRTLAMFGICTTSQLVFGLIAGILAWHCFCYWLDNDVMVIPDNEVDDIIVVEPGTGEGEVEAEEDDLLPEPLPSRHHHHGTHVSLMPEGSKRKDVLGSNARSHAHHHFHHDHFDRKTLIPSGGMESSYQSPTAAPDHHHDHTIEHEPTIRGNHKKETLLEKEEKAVLNRELHGGKVLAEMHVDHKTDKYGNPVPDDDQTKRATLMIVRNKKVTEPPVPPGHHGQTGHLAEDIAEMSGKNAKVKIDDVIIPELEGKHQHHRNNKEELTTQLDSTKKKGGKKEFGSVTGPTAQADIENLIDPTHLRKEAETKAKFKDEERDMIKPHYLGTNPKKIPEHPLEHHVNSEHEPKHHHH